MARFKAHTGFGLKLIEQRATVFRNTHHALFIQVISRFVAIGQHLPQPAQLKQAAVGLENQRRMRPEKPFERFLRNARRRPRRGVAIRELAGIGKAGFHCRRFGAVDNRHLMAGFGQIPRGGHTRHACAQYDDVHVSSSLFIIWHVFAFHLATTLFCSKSGSPPQGKQTLVKAASLIKIK